ncbi:hypothetical protein ACFY3U_18860 [Micromonospora sp. NPDC000089]|uniref:hypothetical protein n=1 Tax=unclassified Micromonospora TaxID=2617518 RepID=UPI003674F15F
MSETDRPQLRTAPAGVTDTALWRLATAVVEAHQPDETGQHCDNLFCHHQEWPCAPYRKAQRALALSGAEPEQPAQQPGRTEQPGRDDRWQEPQRAVPNRRSRTAA